MSTSPPTKAMTTHDNAWEYTVLALAPLCMLAHSLLLGIALAVISASTLAVGHGLSRIVRRHVHEAPEPATGLLLAAAWVSAIDLLLQWLQPELRAALGPFAPLAAASYLLTSLSSTAGTRPTRTLVGGALTLPLITGTARELLGTGRLLSDGALIGVAPFPGWVLFPSAPLPLMALAPGALLILGGLLALRRPSGTS